MSAATATEWLTAAGVGTGLFVPGALAILALDHQPLQRAVGLPLAALVLYLTPTQGGEPR